MGGRVHDGHAPHPGLLLPVPVSAAGPRVPRPVSVAGPQRAVVAGEPAHPLPQRSHLHLRRVHTHRCQPFQGMCFFFKEEDKIC